MEQTFKKGEEESFVSQMLGHLTGVSHTTRQGNSHTTSQGNSHTTRQGDSHTTRQAGRTNGPRDGKGVSVCVGRAGMGGVEHVFSLFG